MPCPLRATVGDLLWHSQLHRGASYGKGNNPPNSQVGAPHLSKQPGAMGEIRNLRPEELCGNQVNGLRDPAAASGQGTTGHVPKDWLSPGRGL